MNEDNRLPEWIRENLIRYGNTALPKEVASLPTNKIAEMIAEQFNIDCNVRSGSLDRKILVAERLKNDS